MTRKTILESLNTFCMAIEQGNSAYLMGTVTSQAAAKIATVGEIAGLQQPVRCRILSNVSKGNAHIVGLEIGRGSYVQRLETRWEPKGQDWVMADANQLLSW